MVEPLSIASSVLPLVGAAIKCSGELLECIHDIRNASVQVENTASSLKSCRLTLHLMQRMSPRASDATNDAGANEDSPLQELLKEFEKTCVRLGRRMPPYTWKYGRLRLSFGRRLSWRWNKTPIRELLRDLQRHQRELSLLLIQQVHVTVNESQTAVQELHTMVEDMRHGRDRVVHTLRRVKAGSAVSEEEERSVKAEFDRLGKTIREVRSYTAISEARSNGSSVASSSPRASWALAPEQPSIDAILDPETRLVRSKSPELHPGYGSEVAHPSAVKRVDGGHSRMQGNTFSARQARRDMRQPVNRESRPEISAPVNVDDPARITHKFVIDATGNLAARPLQAAPKLLEVKSAPTSILDATRDMDEGQTRAYVGGYFDAMNQRIAHAYSAGSLVDRAYDPSETQRDYESEWRRFQLLNRPPGNLSRSPRRAFDVHQDDQPDSESRSTETRAEAPVDLSVNTSQIPSSVSTAPQSSALQQRARNIQMRSDQEYQSRREEVEDVPKARAPQTRRRPPVFNENNSSSMPQTAASYKEALGLSTRDAIPIEEFIPPSAPRATRR